MSQQIKQGFSERFKSGLADNDYRMYCEPLNKRASYKLCLHIIAAQLDKKITNNTYDKCIKAMKCNKCVAAKMALEEKKTGEIIYYKKLEFKNIPEKPMAEPKPVRSIFGFAKNRPISSKTSANNKLKLVDTNSMLKEIISEELK